MSSPFFSTGLGILGDVVDLVLSHRLSNVLLVGKRMIAFHDRSSIRHTA